MSLIRSPVIAKLQQQLKNQNADALEPFWKEQSAQGAPIIESLEGNQKLVTFLFRQKEKGNHILILGGPANRDAIANSLQQLEGSDLWYLSAVMPADMRTTYGFFPHAPILPKFFTAASDYESLGLFFSDMLKNLKDDPLNPKQYKINQGVWLNPQELALSVLELPAAPPQPWLHKDPKVPAGKLEQFSKTSTLLGNERKVWVYTPAGYSDLPHQKEMALLVLFDGHAYTHQVPTMTILDNLIAQGKIAPTMAVFLDNPDDATRDRELGCNDLMPQFLREELLPWLSEHYGVRFTAKTTTIAGSSFGGLAAFYTGLQAPELFGNVLSFSGHLGWGAELDRPDLWIVEQYRQSQRFPDKIYFNVGSLETGSPTFDSKPSFIAANRAMRDVLQSKNTSFRYTEYSGGHDYLCWQQSLAEGLLYLA